MNKIFIAMVLAFGLMACNEGSSVVTEDPNIPPSEPGSSNSQDPDKVYGVLPSNVNVAAVKVRYNEWIGRFYRTFTEEVPESRYQYYPTPLPPEFLGSARILFDDPDYTVSEGIGYGLLLTAVNADWDRFGKLFNYLKIFAVSAEGKDYLMKWKVKGFLNGTGGSATDAEVDILSALFYAYEKTGNESYRDYALQMGHNIYAQEVDPTTKLLLPAPQGIGKLGDGTCFNISYFSPVAIRYLIKYQTDHDWQTVLDNMYAYMIKVQDAGNGLWPDWSDPSGTPTNPNNGSSTGKLNDYWGLEGLRIPWRLAWDYQWYGDERTKQLLTKAYEFAHGITGGNIGNALNRYKYQDAQPSGVGGAQISGVGAFCALGVVAGDDTWLSSCNSKMLDYAFPTNTLYFHPSLQLLYLQLMNGTYVK